MSVTKWKKKKDNPLDLYVDFLNADLSSDPRPKLKKRQKLKDFLNQFEREEILPDKFRGPTLEPILKPDYSFVAFLYFKFSPFLAYIYFRFVVWIEKAKRLQEEMRTDLFPIAARNAIPEKLFPLFERWACLTEKLNEMQFIRRWAQRWDRKGRMTIIAWNLSNNQRENWYAGLAERFEDGDLEKLRLCPVCSRYFAAIKSTDRFCGPLCKRKYDNKDAKFRVKRWRAKNKVIKIKSEKDRKTEEQIKNFSEFMLLEKSHPQDIHRVGQVVLKIGQGDGIKGWRSIKQWEDKLRNGMSPQQLFENLPQAIQVLF